MPAAKGTKPWNDGTGKGWTDKRGYRWIYVFENGRRRAKREHRHIMELHLGRRLLPEEVVHHKNDCKSDNRVENLEVVAWDAHSSHHNSGARRSEYTKRTVSVVAEYREEVKRLKQLNSTLLEALQVARFELRRLLDSKGVAPRVIREWPEIVQIDSAIVAATGGE